MPSVAQGVSIFPWALVLEARSRGREKQGGGRGEKAAPQGPSMILGHRVLAARRGRASG